MSAQIREFALDECGDQPDDRDGQGDGASEQDRILGGLRQAARIGAFTVVELDKLSDEPVAQ